MRDLTFSYQIPHSTAAKRKPSFDSSENHSWATQRCFISKKVRIKHTPCIHGGVVKDSMDRAKGWKFKQKSKITLIPSLHPLWKPIIHDVWKEFSMHYFEKLVRAITKCSQSRIEFFENSHAWITSFRFVFRKYSKKLYFCSRKQFSPPPFLANKSFAAHDKNNFCYTI